ncbi:MAG: hypothetical protein B7Y43_08525 [Sphingomonas sp. 28-62-20]|uniref:pPIWI-associating nuclease domain-containing protein n=1 Tax=Sphingomonas sp. 28-62-20 TaxID=1970433 RepID=UPI000BC9F77C|nr:MAG: hypothetical protein B7Y43_08525 [Sphingomonas sp. 28-62-20]
MTALPKFAPDDREKISHVVDAINRMTETDLDHLNAWQDLMDLSSATIFEAIDADPDSVVIDREGKFEALASVYVMLAYGSSRDPVTMSDEYLATVRGVLDGTAASITEAHVDTSSFYE